MLALWTTMFNVKELRYFPQQCIGVVRLILTTNYLAGIHKHNTLIIDKTH
jgi:hypothetical protein